MAPADNRAAPAASQAATLRAAVGAATTSPLPRPRRRPQAIDLLCALAAACACVAAGLCLLVTPPLMVADEPAHLLRAEQISHGGLLGLQRPANTAGGYVDSGLARLIEVPHDLANGPLLPAERRAMAAMQFSGQLVFYRFPNSVRYGPLCYLPQALGLALARGAGLTPFAAIYVARLCAWLCGCALFVLAYRIGRRLRPLLVAVALLPLYSFEVGSVAQDSILLPLSLVLAASLSTRRCSPRGYALRAAATVAVVMARITYLPLLLLLLLPTGAASVARRRRLSTFGASVAICGAWLAHCLRLRGTMLPNVPPTGGPQLAHMLAHPALFYQLPLQGLVLEADYWWMTLVSLLGWFAVRLPAWCLWAVGAALALAGLCCGLARRRDAGDAGDPWLAPAAAATAVAAAVLVVYANYLSWTPVGAPRADGVFGRYFIPLLPLLGLCVPQLARGAPEAWRRRAQTWLAGAALAIMLAVVWAQFSAMLALYPPRQTWLS